MLTDRDIEEYAEAVLASLAKEPGVTVTSPDLVRGAVRAAVRAAEAEERAIESEAEKALRAHGGDILREGADFRRMLDDAKKILAKKKGFPL